MDMPQSCPRDKGRWAEREGQTHGKVQGSSPLYLTIKSGSTFKGAINSSNSGEVTLVLDKTSSITLTGNTYVKSLTNADSSNSNINLNGYKLYVNGVELKK